MAPALYVLLGRPYGETVALSLVYSVFTKIVGALQHIRQGTVVWNVTLLYGLSGIPAAILGSRMIYLAREETRRLFPFVMGGALFLVAALLLLETALRSAVARERPLSPDRLGPTGILVIVGIQQVIGVLLGLTSVGSGSLVVTSMLLLLRMPARNIVGSNLVIGLIMVIPAGVTHYFAGGVNWRLLAFLLLGSLVGAQLGSRVTMVMPERGLKLVIVALVMVAAVATIMKAW